MPRKPRKGIVENEHAFFRDAAVRLCRHLVFEDALCECARHLRQHIPLDTMFLQTYEPRLGAMRTLAAATAAKGVRLDLLTPAPEIAWAYIHERREREMPDDESIIIFNEPKGNPFAQVMLRSHGIVESSVMRMTLTTDNGRLVGVVLTARGSNRYTEHHAHLLSLIKELLAITIANAFEYQDAMASSEQRRPSGAGRADVEVGPFPTLDDVVAQHIRRALDLTGGKVHGPGGAGELLNVNPNTLRYRMRKLGIAHGRRTRKS